MANDNTIRKEAQRLARADGKTLGLLSMVERMLYEKQAREALEAQSR